MKTYLLILLLFTFANCKITQSANFFQDNEGSWTTNTLTKNRDLIQYDEGGHFTCRIRSFGDENEKLVGEKNVRDFTWQHWIQKKRGYIRLSCPGVDTQRTFHYFIDILHISINCLSFKICCSTSCIYPIINSFY